jgi:hypothetical protein
MARRNRIDGEHEWEEELTKSKEIAGIEEAGIYPQLQHVSFDWAEKTSKEDPIK